MLSKFEVEGGRKRVDWWPVFLDTAEASPQDKTCMQPTGPLILLVLLTLQKGKPEVESIYSCWFGKHNMKYLFDNMQKKMNVIILAAHLPQSLGGTCMNLISNLSQLFDIKVIKQRPIYSA